MSSFLPIVRSQRPQEPVRYVTDGGEIEGDAAPSLFEVVDQVQGRFDSLAISLTQTSDDIGGLARGVRNVVDDIKLVGTQQRPIFVGIETRVVQCLALI